MRSMYLASLHLDFPLGLSNSLPGCENPVAFLFKTLMKPLLYMPPDPLRRASLFPGVKPSCRPVQTVVKSLLYMSPDPLWRASLFPGVKPGCRPVQSLNETPVIYAPGPT